MSRQHVTVSGQQVTEETQMTQEVSRKVSLLEVSLLEVSLLEVSRFPR
jgi:hypothetical protein